MQPLRLDVPGSHPVVADVDRDVGTGTERVRVYLGAVLVLLLAPDTADQLADALIDVAARPIVYPT